MILSNAPSNNSPPSNNRSPTSVAGQGSSSSSTTPMHRRGAFVVLEGVDRCGKTTQSKLLLQRLVAAGLAACSCRFPNRTTATGKLIHEYLTMTPTTTTALNDQAIHLLFSANRWEAVDEITGLLANGTTVLCDRYAHSGVAFSASKVVDVNSDAGNATNVNDNTTSTTSTTPEGQQQKLSFEWCQAPDRGLPAPDCVIFLNLSEKDAEQRGGYGGERYEKRDMQRRVRQRFAELQRLDEETNNNDGKRVRVPWKMIDAAQTVEEVQADIWKAVQETLQKVQEEGKPLGKMWQDGVYDLQVENQDGE